jgi:triosephosphate isomerase (TIM)
MAKKASRRTKIIAGNWKMYPQSLEEVKTIFLKIKKEGDKLPKVKAVLFAPFIYLHEMKKAAGKSRIAVGSQNVFYENQGAFTGEVSPTMLKAAGVSYILIGHSERRALGESDELLNKKIAASVREGLNVIFCIGERVRDNDGLHLDFIKNQIKLGLGKLTEKELEKVTIAYEPVWAIGKSEKEAMQGKDINEMRIYIQKILNDAWSAEVAAQMRILYGGSVTVKNAAEMLREGNIDGLLIGRQSMDPVGFNEILKIANGI